MEQLEKILSGETKVVDLGSFIDLPSTKRELTVEQEIAVWNRLCEWMEELAPKCKFTKDGIANRAERRRRWALFAMFKLYSFRSRHLAVKEAFIRAMGRLSVSWMADVVATEAPAFYYKWAIEEQPDTLRKWGKSVLKHFLASKEHMDMFEGLRPEFVRKAIVSDIMSK